MVQIVKDQHTSWRHARPELADKLANDIIIATIEEKQFELKVRIALEEGRQVVSEIKVMQSHNILQALHLDQFANPRQRRLIGTGKDHLRLLAFGARASEPIKTVDQRHQLRFKKLSEFGKIERTESFAEVGEF